MDETVRWGYCGTMNEKNKVSSILTLAEDAGMSTGLVTTARVTHATPSALYAHCPDRNWESDYDLNRKAKDNATNCRDIGVFCRTPFNARCNTIKSIPSCSIQLQFILCKLVLFA